MDHASQGSWSHAFPDGKVQAAAEIFDGIHLEVWPGVLEPFESGGRKDAAAVIDRSLARLFAYAGDYPARFRLFVSLEHVLLQAGRADVVRANNAEIERTLASWAGTAFDTPSDGGKVSERMLRPIVFSPALAILHGTVELPEMVHPDQLADALAAAAWAGVRRLCGHTLPPKAPRAAPLPRAAEMPLAGI